MTNVFAHFSNRRRPNVLRAFSRVAIGTVLGATLLATVGCSLLPAPTVDPTKYYVMTDRAASESPQSKSASSYHLVLRNIELPGYLRSTRAMVVRDGLNEIRYLDYARWAESLEQGLSRVVKSQLLRSEAVSSVEPVSLPSDFHRAFDVVIRIHLCEGGIADSKKVAKFSASYEIISLETKRVVAQKSYTAPDVAWNGEDFSALAQDLSDSAAALGDDIVANLPK